MTIASKSELAAASTIANLSGIPCSTFEPGSTTYRDAEDVQLTGKPDYRIRRGTIVVNLEWKAGKLNNDHQAIRSPSGSTGFFTSVPCPPALRRLLWIFRFVLTALHRRAPLVDNRIPNMVVSRYFSIPGIQLSEQRHFFPEFLLFFTDG